MAPTRDLAHIDSILRHPDVYYAARDDASAPINQVTMAGKISDPRVLFLRVLGRAVSPKPPPAFACHPTARSESAPYPPADCGLFIFEPAGAGHIVHTCLLPNCRGARAIAAGKLAAAWMFNRTPTTGLISHCWETRPHVLFFAKRVGFVPVPNGKTPWPNRVNGARIFSTGVILTRDRWRQLTQSET